MWYMLIILFIVNDMEILHMYMLIWSFKCLQQLVKSIDWLRWQRLVLLQLSFWEHKLSSIFCNSVLSSFIYMWYMFSILINLNDLNDLHLIMLIWSFKYCWISALLFHIYARINYYYLLILHMLRVCNLYRLQVNEMAEASSSPPSPTP